jgi:hypothetical protein
MATTESLATHEIRKYQEGVLREMCAEAEVEFAGIFDSFQRADGSFTRALACWNSKKTHATYAMDFCEITVKAIRSRTAIMDARFEQVRRERPDGAS